MTVGTMRWVDRFAGIPLCHVVGRWNQLRSRVLRRRPQTGNAVAVFKMFGLGSITLAFPFLAMLAKQRPGAPLLFVSFASNRELLERAPVPMEIVCLRTDSALAFCRDVVKTLRLLRKRDIGEVYDLEFFSKFSTLLSVLSRAPRRFGYALNARWRTLNVTDPVPYRVGIHASGLFLSLLGDRASRTEVDSAGVQRPTSEEQNAVEKLLALDGIGRRRLVAVNPNAGTTSLERRWPLERFGSTIVSYLRGNPETAVILTGDKSEHAYVERLRSIAGTAGGNVFNYAGRLTLGEFLALLERCAWMLTNDSAPMHLASSVGTPLVALFGPESPAMYAPLGKARILSAGLSCSPCLSVYRAKQFTCPYDALCMRSITVPQVLDAIQDVEREPFVRRERA